MRKEKNIKIDKKDLVYIVIFILIMFAIIIVFNKYGMLYHLGVNEKLKDIFSSAIFICFLIILFILIISAINILQTINFKKVYNLTYYDSLTGLLNFKGLQLYSKYCKERSNVLVLFDIDRFHVLNILMGEDYGTDLIKKIAKVLNLSIIVGDNEFVCRVKDDVFALYLKDSNDIKERILSIINECIDCSPKIPIIISCGVFKVPLTHVISTYTMNCCILAKKQAKKIGNEKIIFYNEDIQIEESNNKVLELELDRALTNEEFVVHLQPKINLKTEKLCGCEALVRWNNPNKGLIYPNDFIPLFEKIYRINELDLCVFKLVCKIIKNWICKGYNVLPISVNLSRIHLNDIHLADTLEKITKDYDIPIKYIELEITETAFGDDFIKIISVINNLKKKGFKISMDDFGTGYSVLSNLIEMPVDVIKLDKRFIDVWRKKPDDSVIKGILEIAQNLNIETLIEGIETKEQDEMLKNLNCQIGQGYYYYKPITVKEYEKLMLQD